MAGDIGGAIREGFKAFAGLFKWSKSEVRKLRNAVDMADKLIKRYRDLTPKDQRDDKIEKYADRFYDVIT